MTYLVSHQGQQSGPFTLDEIVRQVRAKELELFDYIYDVEKEDWVLLMEFSALAAKLKDNKPGRPASPTGVSSKIETSSSLEVKTDVDAKSLAVGASASPHAITEWFVLKGENRFGPFPFADVIKMLQQKVLFPFDFVWHAGLESWKRVAELNDFSAETMRQLATAKDMSANFVQRRFQRAKMNTRVIVHDGQTLWRGQSIEISKGGVGLTMQNTLVLPGQQLTVHFSASEGWPAFNAVCEVVAKKFVNDQSPVEYGLRFVSLSQDAQDQLFSRMA